MDRLYRTYQRIRLSGCCALTVVLSLLAAELHGLPVFAGEASGQPGTPVVSAQSGTASLPPEPALATAPTATAAEKPGTIVDVVHSGISRGIQGTATWMDSLFGDWRYASELNESYVRFGYNVLIERDTPVYRKPDMQVRVILPQLKKKTRLVLSGSPRESRDFSAIGMDAQREQIPNSDERNEVSATVHQTFFESAQQSFIIRTGAKLHDFRPVLVLGPRYRVQFPLQPWTLRFSQDVGWASNVGWEGQSVIDVERPLPYSLFFRASNSWVWKEHIDGVAYAVAFSVGQPLGAHRGIDYEWVNIFATRPVHVLSEVDLRMRYRQRLWRDWFFLEVAPQVRFPRDRRFDATPGILFRLDLIFGNYAGFL